MSQHNIISVMADITDALFDFNMDQTAENEQRVDDSLAILGELMKDVKGEMLRLATSIYELATDFTD